MPGEADLDEIEKMQEEAMAGVITTMIITTLIITTMIITTMIITTMVIILNRLRDGEILGERATDDRDHKTWGASQRNEDRYQALTQSLKLCDHFHFSLMITIAQETRRGDWGPAEEQRPVEGGQKIQKKVVKKNNNNIENIQRMFLIGCITKNGKICSGRNQHPWGQAAPEDGQYCLHPGAGGADDVVDDGVVVLLMMWCY